MWVEQLPLQFTEIQAANLPIKLRRTQQKTRGPDKTQGTARQKKSREPHARPSPPLSLSPGTAAPPKPPAQSHPDDSPRPFWRRNLVPKQNICGAAKERKQSGKSARCAQCKLGDQRNLVDSENPIMRGVTIHLCQCHCGASGGSRSKHAKLKGASEGEAMQQLPSAAKVEWTTRAWRLQKFDAVNSTRQGRLRTYSRA